MDGQRYLHVVLATNIFPLFGWVYQHDLSAVEQCFSLTANQPQPAYKPKKTACRTGPFIINWMRYHQSELVLVPLPIGSTVAILSPDAFHQVVVLPAIQGYTYLSSCLWTTLDCCIQISRLQSRSSTPIPCHGPSTPISNHLFSKNL
jgi:hypothetical protein